MRRRVGDLALRTGRAVGPPRSSGRGPGLALQLAHRNSTATSRAAVPTRSRRARPPRPHLTVVMPRKHAFDTTALPGRSVELGRALRVPPGEGFGIAAEVGGQRFGVVQPDETDTGSRPVHVTWLRFAAANRQRSVSQPGRGFCIRRTADQRQPVPVRLKIVRRFDRKAAC